MEIGDSLKVMMYNSVRVSIHDTLWGLVVNSISSKLGSSVYKVIDQITISVNTNRWK